MPHKTNTSSGFTLLEVMVAMVIFSIGLLGLAGIQGIALKNNTTAYMRTIAMQESYNMSDIIRANTATDGSRDAIFTNTLANTSISEPSTKCIAPTATSCSRSEMAQFDVHHWKERLDDALPSGKGEVTFDATDNVFEIIIMWDEERTGTTGTSCGGDPDIDLKCYITHIEV